MFRRLRCWPQLFTDGNIYMVKMDLLDDAVRVLSYDERAALLATAITIDNDYFSRHSRGGYAFLTLVFVGDIHFIDKGKRGRSRETR